MLLLPGISFAECAVAVLFTTQTVSAALTKRIVTNSSSTITTSPPPKSLATAAPTSSLDSQAVPLESFSPHLPFKPTGLPITTSITPLNLTLASPTVIKGSSRLSPFNATGLQGANLTTPFGTCGPCQIRFPEVDMVTWVRARPVSVTVATLIVILNNSTNATTTSTRYNNVTRDLPEAPTTNAAGTAITTLTIESGGMNITTVLAFPTPFFDYSVKYTIDGSYNDTNTCITPNPSVETPLPSALSPKDSGLLPFGFYNDTGDLFVPVRDIVDPTLLARMYPDDTAFSECFHRRQERLPAHYPVFMTMASYLTDTSTSYRGSPPTWVANAPGTLKSVSPQQGNLPAPALAKPAPSDPNTALLDVPKPDTPQHNTDQPIAPQPTPIPGDPSPPQRQPSSPESLVLADDPYNPPPISVGSETLSAVPASNFVIGSQTLNPGGPGITVSDTPISLAPGATAIAIGTSVMAIPPSNPNVAPPNPPVISVGSATLQAVPASNFVIGSQTLNPGGPGITVSDTPISLAPGATAIAIGTSVMAIPPSNPDVGPPPAIAVGSATLRAVSASNYIIDSQTLNPGGPGITVSDTPISLAPGATAIAIGTSVMAIPPSNPNVAPPNPPVISVGSDTLRAVPASNFVIGSQTLNPGGPGITVSDTPISLAPGATAIAIGTSVMAIPPSNPNAASPKPPVITVGSNTITANPASNFIIGSQTLNPGGPQITVSGTPISLAPSATAIAVGGSTMAITPQNTPGGAPVITLGSQTLTANPASDFIVGSQTLVAGGPQITVSGTPVSLAPGATAIAVGGSTMAITPPSSPVVAPVITVGSQILTANPASSFVIGSQTLTPGGPQITVSGTPVSLAPGATEIAVGTSTIALTPPSSPGVASVITIGSQILTANPASSFVIGSQTLIPGGPQITAFGTPVSLAPGGSAIVVGTSTMALTPQKGPGAAPVITVGSQTLTANSASQFIIGSQTLVPGGPQITVSGTPISLAPSATAIVIGTSTLGIPPPKNLGGVTSPPVITLGSQTLTANSASQFVIGSQTLIPGGPQITVSGTPVSLAPGASSIVVGTSTIALKPPNISSGAQTITIGSQTFTVNSASQFIIGSQTLTPGGPQITVSGTPISLAPGATQVVVGTSTIPITRAATTTYPTAVNPKASTTTGAPSSTRLSSSASGGRLGKGGAVVWIIHWGKTACEYGLRVLPNPVSRYDAVATLFANAHANFRGSRLSF